MPTNKDDRKSRRPFGGIEAWRLEHTEYGSLFCLTCFELLEEELYGKTGEVRGVHEPAPYRLSHEFIDGRSTWRPEHDACGNPFWQ